MAYQLSPGVNVSEIDLSTIIPAVGTTTGAFAGNFAWGPANTVVGISDEIDLVNRFGLPNANTYESFFTAANFLAYGNSLKVVRAIATTGRNASSNSGNLLARSAAVLVSNRDEYEATYSTLAQNVEASMFMAKYPGILGNSLRVSVAANAANFSASNSYSYYSLYNSAPGTSSYAADVGGTNDEMHITVIDSGGYITGTAGTVLEKFAYVSKARDAKNADGSSNYYLNVLNDQSKYVYAWNSPNTTWGNTASGLIFGSGPKDNYDVYLTGGVDAYSDADANSNNSGLVSAYDKFKNVDDLDISLIMMGSASNVVCKYVVDNIAEVRKDCVVFISPRKDDVVNKPGNEVTYISNTRIGFNASSYAFMDNNWKYQFDKYNNVYRWVPLNGDIAGLCVRTDTQRDPWFSPAGFNRGQIKNVTKLAWNATKSQRDDLYKIGVNSVVSFQGDGVVLYGDKTMQTKPSAFDRINVRRLFIVLEKAISRAAKYSLFEFNDEFTRAQFKSLVEPYLRDVQGRRGIFDFKVVCDTTNNTPEVIDRNEFVGDIYIKPARSINFIQLNFVADRTGVSFETIVGRF
jgi:phage tail sheath protein FI